MGHSGVSTCQEDMRELIKKEVAVSLEPYKGGLLEAANKKADLQDEVLARTKRRRKSKQNCRMR